MTPGVNVMYLMLKMYCVHIIEYDVESEARIVHSVAIY